MIVFLPVPHTVVSSPCSWTVRRNVRPDRIPSECPPGSSAPQCWPIFADTITEIVCQNPSEGCAGARFKCRQMKTVMQVMYLEGVTTTNLGGRLPLAQAFIRNLTVRVGCSCVLRWGPRSPVSSLSSPLQTAGVLRSPPARAQGEEVALRSHSDLKSGEEQF